MRISLPFQLYLAFHWRYFPENTYLALFAHALQTFATLHFYAETWSEVAVILCIVSAFSWYSK